MSKFSSFAEYPPRSLAGAEAALLTAWASLERFHENLVLVGGMAVKYLTKQGAGLLPGPVTMDVDLGVALAAEASGQYGSMADDLSGQGFKLDEKGRYVRQFETMPVFIDFLTEHPTATTGTVGVDGVPAGVFPGVARALATRRKVTVGGKDLFGAPQEAAVPVSGIGPLLVLKLNAFAGRQQAKDAYDVLLAVSRFTDGPDAAIAANVLLYKDGGRPGEYEPHVSMFGDEFPFEKCSINEHGYRLRANERLSQEYLYFWLTSEMVLAQMRVKGTGVAIPGLNSTAVRSLTTLVPPKPILEAFTKQAAPLVTRILDNSKKSRTIATLGDTLLPKLLSGELSVADTKLLK
jgi:hypothetical protein